MKSSMTTTSRLGLCCLMTSLPVTIRTDALRESGNCTATNENVASPGEQPSATQGLGEGKEGMRVKRPQPGGWETARRLDTRLRASSWM